MKNIRKNTWREGWMCLGSWLLWVQNILTGSVVPWESIWRDCWSLWTRSSSKQLTLWQTRFRTWKLADTKVLASSDILPQAGTHLMFLPLPDTAQSCRNQAFITKLERNVYIQSHNNMTAFGQGKPVVWFVWIQTWRMGQKGEMGSNVSWHLKTQELGVSMLCAWEDGYSRSRRIREFVLPPQFFVSPQYIDTPTHYWVSGSSFESETQMITSSRNMPTDTLWDGILPASWSSIPQLIKLTHKTNLPYWVWLQNEN